MLKKLPSMVLAIVVSGCSAGGGQVYSLYRNSVVDSSMRLHVATFDANESEAYNQENCQVARDLFQAQPNIATSFWCEKGTYKK